MKKNMKYYLIFWFVLVAVFNIICFGVPEIVDSFWLGYGLMMASFLAHLVYAFFAFGRKEERKGRGNVALIVVSFVELLLMMIAGAVCMVIPELPDWIGAAVGILILIFSVLFIGTKTVEENAWNANEELNQKTQVWRDLTDQAQLLQRKAENAEIKEMARQVYEAIRYSDPVSSEGTKVCEERIALKLKELSEAMERHQPKESIKAVMNDVLYLVEERNHRCKAAK